MLFGRWFDVETGKVIIRVLVSIILLVLLPLNTHANECFSPSPVTKLGGNVNETPMLASNNIDSGDYATVLSFFRLLNGTWVGEGQEVVCEGTENDTKKRVSGLDIELKVRANSSDAVYFTAMLKNIAQKTSTSEGFSLVKDRNAFSLSGEDSTTIKVLGDSVMGIHTHYVTGKRVPGTMGGTNYIVHGYEVVRKFKLSGDNLNITIRRYSLGAMISSQSWDLKRD